MKKKSLALPAFLLLLAGLTLLLSACRSEESDLSSVLPPPESSSYQPEPLDVEFFNRTSSNLSGWKKYPHPVTDPPASSEEDPSLSGNESTPEE